MRVPLRLQARAVTGVGDVAGAILANVRLEGMLAVTPQLVRGDNLALTSDKLKGKVSLLIDLRTGRFDIVISGGLTRYLIPGLGIVDVKTDLHVVPGAERQGAGASARPRPGCGGSTTASSRDLTGGLPRLTTDLERTHRRHPAFHQSAALFARPAAVGLGHPPPRRHLPYRGAAGGRRNTGRCG